MSYNDTPPESPGLVSPCCGYEYSECYDAGYSDGYICENKKCLDWFAYPEEKHEYNERMRENALEEKADAKRKYNE